MLLDGARATGWTLRLLTAFYAGGACYGMPLRGSSPADDHCEALETWSGRRPTLVRGARGRRWKVSLVVTKSRPLGQGSGPARPAECRARPSTCAVRMVSEMAVAVGHRRPEDGSSVAHLEPPTPARTYSPLGGKMRPLDPCTIDQ